MWESCHFNSTLHVEIGVEFWIFVYFFCFYFVIKRNKLHKFSQCNHNGRCPKKIFKQKNTTTEIIRYSSSMSIFNDKSKWHSSHIKYLFINTIVYFFILQKRRLIFVKSAIYVFLVNSIVMSAQLHINKEWWE